MKKLALVLTFVFGVAMIAPAFAADPVKKDATKTECTKDAKGACSKDCKKGVEPFALTIMRSLALIISSGID